MPPTNPDLLLAEIHAQDANKKAMRNTPETFVVAALMVAAAVTWITITINRSHHTAAAPSTVSSPAALPARPTPG